MSETKLVGYARRSLTGNTLTVNLSVDAFMKAERYTGKDGSEYVSLTAFADKVRMVLDGNREVTAVMQINTDE